MAAKGGRRISLYRNVACSAKRTRFNIVYKLFSAKIAIGRYTNWFAQDFEFPVGKTRYFV